MQHFLKSRGCRSYSDCIQKPDHGKKTLTTARLPSSCSSETTPFQSRKKKWEVRAWDVLLWLTNSKHPLQNKAIHQTSYFFLPCVPWNETHRSVWTLQETNPFDLQNSGIMVMRFCPTPKVFWQCSSHKVKNTADHRHHLTNCRRLLEAGWWNAIHGFYKRVTQMSSETVFIQVGGRTI